MPCKTDNSGPVVSPPNRQSECAGTVQAQRLSAGSCSMRAPQRILAAPRPVQVLVPLDSMHHHTPVKVVLSGLSRLWGPAVRPKWLSNAAHRDLWGHALSDAAPACREGVAGHLPICNMAPSVLLTLLSAKSRSTAQSGFSQQCMHAEVSATMSVCIG